MTLYIIANPYAGNGRAKTVVKEVERIWTFSQVVPFYTQKNGDEKKQVQKLEKMFRLKEDYLLVLGGDGTLSKVLSCLARDIPFAYYPLGSGNDFARVLPNYGLKDLLAAMQKRASIELFLYAYEGGIILNSLDTGFAAWVIQSAEHSKLKKTLKRWGLGSLAYIFYGVLGIFLAPTADLYLENQAGQKKSLSQLFFFSLANNRYFGGGIMIWPQASAFKEGLDMVYGQKLGILKRINFLLALLLRKHRKRQFIRHEEVERLVLEVDESCLVQVDGEMVAERYFELVRESRQIYLP
ncbi:diacylglycerol/lipid kinase family protein [Streptococcus loxodontisalivarius]|uniref:Diacylglycerol kinase family enzyme n=1 Tax=Streptococcus loxodontisalivarius TaxID=1349415 RepID=A0ABS2PPB5_9STRE|nr:diacylglycerol kinase family protein [Streptococcus loxodontisalivarius]MBM7641879.1 diacylglycerol kinase family enzyme [Streptococcus loxodontisalivarius]